MLGSSLKDDEILPESPDANPRDLIPSYLPGTHSQASFTAMRGAHDRLSHALQACNPTSQRIMCAYLQVEETDLGSLFHEDTAAIHGESLEHLLHCRVHPGCIVLELQ